LRKNLWLFLNSALFHLPLVLHFRLKFASLMWCTAPAHRNCNYSSC
jgi:hypothetical protein